MPIRNIFLEAWSALSATGLLALALIMMVAPFFFSLIANIGRPVPRTAPRAARIKAPRHRAIQAARPLSH